MSYYNYSNRYNDVHSKEKFVRVSRRYNRHNPRPDTRLYKFEEIPEFWGSNYPNPIKEWLSLLDKYFDYFGFHDYQKVERCRVKLKGIAALSVNLREWKKPIRCWSELKNMILEEYSLTKDPSPSPPSNELSINPPHNLKESHRVESPLNKVIESSPLPIVLPPSPSNEIVAPTHNLFCEVHGKMKINIDIDKVAVEIHFMLQDFNVGNEVWVRILLCSRSPFCADHYPPPVRETAPQHPLLITLPAWENLKTRFKALKISFPLMWPLQEMIPTILQDSLGNGKPLDNNFIPTRQGRQLRTIEGIEDPLQSPSVSWRSFKKMIAKVVQDIGVFHAREKYVVPPPPPWLLWEDKHALSLHALRGRFHFATEDGLYKFLAHWRGKPKVMILVDSEPTRSPPLQKSFQFKPFDPGG